MPIKIDPIPELPDELLAAAQAGRLVPFVGAGVSRLAGCPGWDDMANAALKQMVDAGKLSYAELEQCHAITAPRIKLSMAELIGLAGGVVGELKTFSPGGASSGFLPADRVDVAMDFKALGEAYDRKLPVCFHFFQGRDGT